MKKKITQKYLLKYAYSKKKKPADSSIVFRHTNRYYIGFNKSGQVKLFDYPDWDENIVVLSRKMSYEDMLDIIKKYN